MTSHLLDLARRVEGLTGPDREVDVEIARHRRVTVWKRNDDDTANFETTHWHYTGSIDAALTLVPEGWSMGLWRTIGKPESCRLWDDTRDIITRGATPALALCAASLRAIAGEGA